MKEYEQPACYIKEGKNNVWSRTNWCNQVDSNKLNKAKVTNCFAGDCWIKSRSILKRLYYAYGSIFKYFRIPTYYFNQCKNTFRQMLVRFVWCVKTVFFFITFISFFVPYLLLNLEDLQCEKDIVLWCVHVD